MEIFVCTVKMRERKVTILTWLIIATAVSMIPSQQQLDPKLTEYVWFDNDIAVGVWNKDEPHQAVKILSAALDTLLNSPWSRNNKTDKMKVPKSRIRL